MISDYVKSWIIKILDRYIEGLNKDTLKFEVWKGFVELHNLRIKKDVIDLPYNIKYSYIGKLRIEIPWNNIFKINSIKILISDLHLVAGPLTVITNDMVEKRKAKQRENDLIKLSLLDLAKKITTEKQDTDEPISSWKLSFLRQLGKSLDIKIQNVHVRYEDEFTYAPEIISYGFFINSIRLKLSNNEELFEKGKLKFTQLEYERYVHKKFSIVDFGFYCHLNDNLFANESEDNTLEKMINLLNKSKTKDDSEINYILHPINLSFVFSQLLGPAEEHLPQTLFDVKLSPIDISLNDLQLKIFYSLSKRIEEFNMKIKLKELRPRIRPAENPRAWWVYLKRIYLPNFKDRIEKSSLRYLEKRRKERLLYIELRKKRNNKTLTSAEKYQLDSLDRKLPLSDIRYYRALADIEIYLSGESFLETHQPSGYWNWITFWKKHPPNSEQRTNFLTTSLRNHLIESLGGKTKKTRKDKKVEEIERSVLGKVSLPRFTITLYKKAKKGNETLINFYLRNSYLNASIGFKKETDIMNRVQLDIREIGIKLPAKYSNGVHSLLFSTSALITLFFESNNKNLVVEFNNLNMKKSFLSENNKIRNVYLLSPLFISINAEISESENKRITKAKVIGNKFSLSISEKDLFFIIYLIGTLKEVLVDSLKRDWTPTIPEDIRRSLSYKKEDKIVMESDEEEYIKNRFIISLTILNICFSILDDTKGTNRVLFDLLLSDIISDVDINESNINASAHLKLSADYKNEQHKWNPLIKQWPLYIGFSQSDLSQKLFIWTHKKLNIILSNTFLKNLSDFSKSWDFNLIKDLLDKSKSEKIVKHIIRSNDKGWREFHTIPDFQNKFVVMNELGSDLNYNIFYKNHVPHITFQVENFISPEVKLSPGSHCVQLEPAKIGSVVLLNCKIIDQITYISLTSTIKIKNSCKSRRIRIGHIEHKNMNEHLVIERGQEIYMPWNWISRNFLEFPISIDGYKIQLEAPISKGSVYSIEVSFSSYDDSTNKKVNWGDLETLIEIKPPLKLKNLLPCDIQYKILDNSKSNMEANHFIQGNIDFESEEELFIENISFNTIMFSVKLPNCSFSDYTFIGYENRDDCVFFMKDNCEFPVYLDYEYDLTSLSISIYNKYWIINKLGVPIDIENAVSDNKLIDVSGNDKFEGLPLLTNEQILEMKPFICDINDKEMQLNLRISHNNNDYLKTSLKKSTSSLSLKWDNSKYFEILASVREAKGEFFRTKLIYLKPKFMITNNGDSILHIRISKGVDNIEYEILPNQNQPLYLTFGENHLSFSFRLHDYDWTSIIIADKTQSIPLKHTREGQSLYSFVDILVENNVLIKISYENQSYDHLKSIYLPNDVIIHPIETKSGVRYIPHEKDGKYQITDYETESETKREHNIIVNLSGVILNLVDDIENIEVVSLVLDNIYLAINIIQKFRSFDFCLRGFQIDNPYYRYINSKFRNILIAHPSFKKQYKKNNDSNCFLQIKAGQSYVYKDLSYLDLDVSLQDIYLTVDQAFIESLLNFIFKVSKYQESKLQSVSSVLEDQNFEMGSSIYIHKMDISPIFVSITFSMSEANQKETSYIPTALNLLGFQDFALNLNRLTKNQMFLYKEELTSILINFYRKEVLKQAFKVFTSLELIGSPLSMFNEFSHSIGSVFNEPFSPYSALIGSYSLLLHTASGLSNSTAKVTGIISKFLSRLVKEPTPRQKNINLFEDYESSLLQDRLWNLKDSVIDSIIGLVRQPIKRAMESGTKGLAMGTISGLIDLIAKPSIAVLDIIQGTAEYYHKITNPTPLRWKAPTLRINEYVSEKENIEQILNNLKVQFPDLKEIFDELENLLHVDK